MRNKWLIYVSFFGILLTGFYYFLFRDADISKSNLAVINDHVQPFSFIDQNGKAISDRAIDGKVCLVNYFFTTCKAICPKMNANVRRVYDVYKNEPRFVIISHTCMPEVDSVPLLKQYEQKMINGQLIMGADGLYKIKFDSSMIKPVASTNWYFVTGSKASLYNMAMHSYMIDDPKRDTTQPLSDQFVHTQLFALLDKQRRVRGIYDGLKEDEIQRLITDIKSLLNENIPGANLANGFSNTPN